MLHRSWWAAVVWMLAVLFPRLAEATVASCGSVDDAPSGFTSSSCSSVCTEGGGELLCDMAAACGSTGGSATMVTTFGSSTHDISVWGACGATKFCCVFDEASAIATVSLKGTTGNDDLFFVYDYNGANEESLEPWDADSIDAFMQGLAGNDGLDGSDYAGGDYDESMNGNQGNDGLSGHAGGDFLKGGDGDDILIGGDGWDTLWGGDGDDSLEGEDGNDVLCDSTGFDHQADQWGAMMLGGNGDDKLWYTGGTWSTPLLEGTDDAGAGSDACGDDNLRALRQTDDPVQVTSASGRPCSSTRRGTPTARPGPSRARRR